MKINLFENKYHKSNIMKIFFADIVCFLLVAVVSIGVCYSYFSHGIDIAGSGKMANVSVQYQYDKTTDGVYEAVDEVYGKVNGGTERLLTDLIITPGDEITIVGRAVNTGNVSVYVIAKLTVVTSRGTDIIYYNIGNNDPGLDGYENSDALPNSKENHEYLELYAENMTNNGVTHKVHQIGAGSLAGSKEVEGVTTYYHKDLAISYTFDGDTYENGDTVTSISLELLVHQRQYLNTAPDIDLYNSHATNGKINGYSVESIYAVHYMLDEKLS